MTAERPYLRALLTSAGSPGAKFDAASLASHGNRRIESNGTSPVPAEFITAGIRAGIFDKAIDGGKKNQFTTTFRQYLVENITKAYALAGSNEQDRQRVFIENTTPYLTAFMDIAEELINEDEPDFELQVHLANSIQWLGAIAPKFGNDIYHSPLPKPNRLSTWFDIDIDTDSIAPEGKTGIMALNAAYDFVEQIAPGISDYEARKDRLLHGRNLQTLMIAEPYKDPEVFPDMVYMDGRGTQMLAEYIHKSNPFTSLSEQDSTVFHDQKHLAARGLLGIYALDVRRNNVESGQTWPPNKSKILTMSDGRKVLACRATYDDPTTENRAKIRWQELTGSHPDSYHYIYEEERVKALGRLTIDSPPVQAIVQHKTESAEAAAIQGSVGIVARIEAVEANPEMIDANILGSLVVLGNNRYKLTDTSGKFRSLGVNDLVVSWDKANSGYDVIGKVGDHTFTVFLASDGDSLGAVAEVSIGSTFSEETACVVGKYCVNKLLGYFEDQYRAEERRFGGVVDTKRKNPSSPLEEHLRLNHVGWQCNQKDGEKADRSLRRSNKKMGIRELNDVVQSTFRDLSRYNGLPEAQQKMIDNIVMRAYKRNLDPSWQNYYIRPDGTRVDFGCDRLVLLNPTGKNTDQERAADPLHTKYSPLDPNYTLSLSYIVSEDAQTPRTVGMSVDCTDIVEYLRMTEVEGQIAVSGTVFKS